MAASAIRREDLARATGTLGKRRWYRPVVHLLEVPGGKADVPGGTADVPGGTADVHGGQADDHGLRAVVKDFRPCPWFWRATYGRYLNWRECSAYGRLDGVEGIPRYLGRIDGHAFAIEWVPGKDLGKCPKGSLGIETFRRLAATVDAMHARGVVHLDLRQRRNVLVDESGVPRVIDFSSGFTLSPGGWLMRRLAPIDRSGVLKYQRRFLPESLTEEERKRLANLESWRRFWPFS